MHQLGNLLVLICIGISVVNCYRILNRVFTGYSILVKASVAAISVLGAISICILIAVSFAIPKGAVTILTICMLVSLSIFWFLKIREHKTEQIHIGLWKTELAIIFVAIILTSYVVLTGVCDALSCDTVHHLAHLMQFSISNVLSFETYSITDSLPNDVNFYAYVGATYLPLLYMFSLWLGISYELIFIYALPVLSIFVYLTGACFLGRVVSSTSLLSLSGREIASGVSVFGILSTYYSVTLSGHPQLWAMAYPSIIANGLGLHLLAFFVFLLKQENATTDNYVIFFLIVLAVVPLHSGFSIIIGVFVGLLWTVNFISLLSRKHSNAKKMLKPSTIVFTIFLVGWFISIVPKLFGLTTYGSSIAPHLEDYYTVPLLVDTDYGRIFTKEIFSQLRIFLLIYSGIICIAFCKKNLKYIPPTNISIISKLYITVLFCYLLLFVPGATEFLIHKLSFGLLVRLHWFTDLILLIISALLSVEVISLIFGARRQIATNIFIAALSLVVFYSIHSHYSFIQKSRFYWPQQDVLTRPEVLNNQAYVKFLESLPMGTQYVVYNRGTYNASVKHIETNMIKGKIIPPLYAFSEAELAIAAECSIEPQASKLKLETLIQHCNPDYIIFWEWPEKERDPLITSKVSTPFRRFNIERKVGKDIVINVHKITDL